MMRRLPFVLLLCALACNGQQHPDGKVPLVTPTASSHALDARPRLAPPVPYKAPEPEVYRTAEGLTVWLLHRPALPVVSMSLSIPVGSADDPLGKEGLAYIASSMMDEGAGDRGALDISSDIKELGAALYTQASLDGSTVSLSVLKKYSPQAFSIFADVVARPRFDQAEFDRVKVLWQNQLKRRSDSPRLVASVVARAVLYGPGTPYGHPSSGQLHSAESITRDDALGMYKEHWRPDTALLVVAGDLTRQELDGLIGTSLADWKRPPTPPPARAEAPTPLSARPRLVLVDRPDAPQAVVSVIRPGVAASDPDAPLLDLVNTALGGSFTSRLMQNLREDHGWTYGAGSGFGESRGVGPFVARAAVFTNVTGVALKEMLAEIDKMRAEGLTEQEYVKVRAGDLTDLIQGHETVDRLAGRLSQLGVLGLPPGFDATASAARQRATLEQLAALSKTHLDISDASIVVVGPKAQVDAQLKILDLGAPEMWTADGQPVKSK